MPLKLIGAAFPRTGTMSLKKALEDIGFGKCYHMHELFLNPDHIPIWQTAGSGETPDWSKIFKNYSAALDTPACLYWHELHLAFPEAKIILLKRDPMEWYESLYETAYQVITGPGGDNDPALKLVRRDFFDVFMQGKFSDQAFAISIYQQYCENVINKFSKDQLLIYHISDGWLPLCKFIGYKIPDFDFPFKNTRADFRARMT